MEERYELFCALTTKISRSIKKIKNLETEEFGLRSPHVSCVYYLYIADGMTATELCERCEEDKASISRALDYLETNGFIVCESKSAKRYKSPLHLTALGRTVGEKIHQRISRVLDEVSLVLSDEERVSLYRSLTLISESLEQYMKNQQ
ncbi:MAG: MarR family transcriptional regulator [Clostridia bacterium]|nr:MarR family transcriptional regulator [Clostridia bacterium]